MCCQQFFHICNKEDKNVKVKEDKNVEIEDVQDLLSSFSSAHMLLWRIEMYNFHEYLTELP